MAEWYARQGYAAGQYKFFSCPRCGMVQRLQRAAPPNGIACCHEQHSHVSLLAPVSRCSHEQGLCPYSEACFYAHGPQDVRQDVSHLVAAWRATQSGGCPAAVTTAPLGLHQPLTFVVCL